MPTDTAAARVASKASSQPPVFIRNAAVFAQKRRLALITIWVPTLGAAAAIALAILFGISWLEVTLLVGMYTLTMFGLEVGFHRAFSHKAFVSSKPLKWLMAVSGSMAAQGTLHYWIATHRRHHSHSDTAEDAHSPHWRMGEHGPERMYGWRGLYHAQLGNMYKDYATNATLFARDMLKDPLLAKVSEQYRLWVVVGLVLPTAIGGLVHMSLYGALMGLLWGGLLRIFCVHHAYFTNASFSHTFGAKPFDNGDQSSNNLWCTIPTFGSALQNNHHAFPGSAQLGIKAYEIDIGMWFIAVLERLGLVRDVKRVSPDMIRRALASATQPEPTGADEVVALSGR